MAGVKFDQTTAQRVLNATRKVERQPQDMTGGRQPPSTSSETAFWAIVLPTGQSVTAGPTYTLSRAVQSPGGQWQPVATSTIDEHGLQTWTDALTDSAQEINGRQDVPALEVVRCWFSGYDADGEPVYYFLWGGMQEAVGMRVHDHRDNANGGFAFAVYHPGTDLPMTAWGI